VIRYVLDTSVMLRWFSQEHDAFTERVLRLREEQLEEAIELAVMDQSVYELLHVLKEKAGFDRARLDSALASLDYMHLNIFTYSPEIMHKSIQIAREYDISIYDSCFIALGAHLRCQAVTCDEELYRKVSTLPWTILLSNLNF
jgi:predicted nucleic acid-binding protein